jgi:hypothetical protein
MNRCETGITDTLKERLDHQFPQTSFDVVWNANRTKKTIRTHKLKIFTILAAILLVTTAFSYYKFFWGNTDIIISKSDEDLTQYITPLESINQITNGAKTFNLFESRKYVNFSIYKPSGIESWTQIKSVGVVKPASISKGGKTIIVDGPLVYFDFYVSDTRHDEKIVVSQQYDSTSTAALKKEENHSYTSIYPKGSKILTDFGSDFAVLMNLQKGRYQLHIIHIEENGIATMIDIYGNTKLTTLMDIARKYLSAPSDEQ